MALLATASLFSGREKATQDVPAPKSTKSNSAFQAAWGGFAREVERGERIDPVGQYVAKGTRAPVDASENRIRRPKPDVSLRGPQKDFALRATTGSTVKKISSSKTVSAGFAEQPCDTNTTGPDAPCYPGPGSSGGSQTWSEFVGSEGIAPRSGAGNPQEYIVDLKIALHDGGASACLRADCERFPRTVTGPVTNLGMKTTTNKSYSSLPGLGHTTVTGLVCDFIQTMDLTADAGGNHIYP